MRALTNLRGANNLAGCTSSVALPGSTLSFWACRPLGRVAEGSACAGLLPQPCDIAKIKEDGVVWARRSFHKRNLVPLRCEMTSYRDALAPRTLGEGIPVVLHLDAHFEHERMVFRVHSDAAV